MPIRSRARWRLLRTQTGTNHPMEGHKACINQLVVWEGKLISCSYDDTIMVWSTGDGQECQQTLQGHTDEVRMMAVLGDKLVTGSIEYIICSKSAEKPAPLGRPKNCTSHRIILANTGAPTRKPSR